MFYSYLHPIVASLILWMTQNRSLSTDLNGLCETVNRTSQASRLNTLIPYNVFTESRYRVLIYCVWIRCIILSLEVQILDIEQRADHEQHAYVDILHFVASSSL